MDKKSRHPVIGFRLDPQLWARVQDWQSNQEFPPTNTAIAEAALREFLDGRDEFEHSDDVIEALRQGRITRDKANAILIEMGK